MRSVNPIIVAYFVLWITGKDVEKVAELQKSTELRKGRAVTG